MELLRVGLCGNRLVPAIRLPRARFFLCLLILWAGASRAFSQAASVTSLSITAGGAPVASVQQGTVVSLTATVTSGGQPVTPGQVEFCDANALTCSDIHQLGLAQLTSSGTAVYRFVPGSGNHAYKAVFLGTHHAATSSAALQSLTVSANYATTTVLTASGSSGNETLTATVTSTAGSVPPTGTVSFLDTSNANYVLATAPPTPNPGPPSYSTLISYVSPNTYTDLSGWFSPSGLFATVGDFNNDGRPDVLITSDGDQAANIYLGNGDGTLTGVQGSPNIQEGPSYSAVVGDFNSDGNQDFALVRQADAMVDIFLGHGDGTFNLWQSIAIPLAEWAETADFNGDGIADLAVLSSSGTLSILQGHGDGTFTLSKLITLGMTPVSIVSGDFNHDGKTDLAILGRQTPNAIVQVLLSHGDGTFTVVSSPSVMAIGSVPDFLAAGDFNGDGILDLAVANQNPQTVTLLLGNGDGTFVPAGDLPGNGAVESVTVGDFNGDGKADLATANELAKTNHVLEIFLGHGDGSFDPVRTDRAGQLPVYAAAVDLNSDGIDDFAVAQEVYPPPPYPPPPSPPPYPNTSFVDVVLSQEGSSSTATVTGVSVIGDSIHLVDATYPGDNSNRSSTSILVPVAAQPQITTTTLTVSQTTVSYGQPVTLTATLSPTTAQDHTASGTVIFELGNALLGSVPLVNGRATYTTNLLPSGADSLSATYMSDDNFASSTSSGIVVDVIPLVTATTLSASPNPAGVNQTVTLIAAVAGSQCTPGYPCTPTGLATFKDGSNLLGKATLDVYGNAKFTTSSLALGTHILTASYPGSTVYAPSASSPVTVVVEVSGFGLTLSNPSITLATHQHTTNTVTLTSVGHFVDTIALACSNLPQYVTCALTPASANLTASGTATVSLYIDTNATLAETARSGSGRTPSGRTPLALLLGPAGLLAAITRRSKRRPWSAVTILSVWLLPAALCLTGCTTKILSLRSAAPGTYQVLVTGKGATTGATHTAVLTLTVTP